MRGIMSVITLASIIMSTLGADLTLGSMYCSDAGNPPRNNLELPLTWSKSGYFFSGMESYHDKGKKDRRYTIRYCKTIPDEIRDGQSLPSTQYDAHWIRGCGGGSAIYSGYSTHDNSKEDRKFTFECGATSNDFLFDSCEWRGYYPNIFEEGFHENCPNNGIIRTIESYHNSDFEDRKWRFECCKVYDNPYEYTPMTCSENNFYSNELDGSFNNVAKTNYFISGMYSVHDSGKEDRRFRWKFCKPNDGSGSYIGVKGALPETDWDASWTRSCNTFNGGNAAMIKVESYHDSGKEDRRFTFTCGLLDNEEHELVNCGLTGYLNEYDGELDFHCPNNGVIRGIKSWHDSYYEDRQFRFDCCTIARRNYEFTNMEGYWSLVASASGSGSITQSITRGTQRKDSNKITKEFSSSLSVAVSVGYEFVGYSGGVEITGTIAQSTATTISSSFTEYEETTIEISCAEGVEYLYQFVMESDQSSTYTQQYRCTNIPNPACGPAFFDCEPNNPNCHQCKSGWPISGGR